MCWLRDLLWVSLSYNYEKSNFLAKKSKNLMSGWKRMSWGRVSHMSCVSCFQLHRIRVAEKRMMMRLVVKAAEKQWGSWCKGLEQAPAVMAPGGVTTIMTSRQPPPDLQTELGLTQTSYWCLRGGSKDQFDKWYAALLKLLFLWFALWLKREEHGAGQLCDFTTLHCNVLKSATN